MLSHCNRWRSLGDSNPCFRRERANDEGQMLMPGGAARRSEAVRLAGLSPAITD